MVCGFLRTGQTSCHDSRGRSVPCAGSGQDAESRSGIAWPEPRFAATDALVKDRLTGLTWTRRANFAEFPLTWREALAFIDGMNREGVLGFNDWRLPNRRELRSLVSCQTRKPALPEGHPFSDVFLGWYWSSTSAAVSPDHAWYLHLEGARLFYGGKDQSFLVWPVRGRCRDVLPCTGQTRCFDEAGAPVPCEGSGQDGAYRSGHPWPVPRFAPHGGQVLDRLTGLCWRRDADLAGEAVNWEEALAAVAALEHAEAVGWRLPNINELESLVDADRHGPALPADAPFDAVREGYWSSTTSQFEPDWAWALYLRTGAVGIGQKAGRHFHVWAVRRA
jgi:hypothetical protein